MHQWKRRPRHPLLFSLKLDKQLKHEPKIDATRELCESLIQRNLIDTVLYILQPVSQFTVYRSAVFFRMLWL